MPLTIRAEQMAVLTGRAGAAGRHRVAASAASTAAAAAGDPAQAREQAAAAPKPLIGLCLRPEQLRVLSRAPVSPLATGRGAVRQPSAEHELEQHAADVSQPPSNGGDGPAAGASSRTPPVESIARRPVSIRPEQMAMLRAGRDRRRHTT